MSNYSDNPNSCRVDSRERPDAYQGMTAVCLHPYHELEHPITLVV